MADHYETLGVAGDATQDEIKRAYRRLAREHHPDANPTDAAAVERFKEISRAYEVLSDPQKRRLYDTYGDERVGAAHFRDFGGISDLFSAFFGGMGETRTRRGPARGADVVAEIEITLEEAATGVERDIEVTTLQECTDCHGTGAAAGTFPSRCSVCGGTGEIRQVRQTIFGNMMTATTCPRCRGSGEEFVERCRTCDGRGRVRSAETLTVQIPAGIDEGAQLRVTGRGEAGVRGGGSGDLYVVVHIDEHDVFRRVGDDLGCEVAVPMSVAALGGTVEVPTLDGSEPVDIAPGTQSGEVVRLKNKGMPRLGGRGRGELVALLKVETPTDLTEEQAELLERLARLRGEEIGDHRGLFSRVSARFRTG